MVNLRWEIVVRFVDIGGIIDNNCILFLKNNISHKVLSMHLDDVRVDDAYIMTNSGNMRDICEKYPTI